jgi:hypothetical protein
MGFFDFLKPKKSGLENTLSNLYNSIFPKGDKDINAATDELLRILNHSIDRSEAKNIAVKSVSLSRITETFDEQRLRVHLGGYCLHHFNDAQVKQFHGYLAFLIVASVMFGKSPSEVICNGDFYTV